MAHAEAKQGFHFFYSSLCILLTVINPKNPKNTKRKRRKKKKNSIHSFSQSLSEEVLTQKPCQQIVVPLKSIPAVESVPILCPGTLTQTPSAATRCRKLPSQAGNRVDSDAAHVDAGHDGGLRVGKRRPAALLVAVDGHVRCRRLKYQRWHVGVVDELHLDRWGHLRLQQLHQLHNRVLVNRQPSHDVIVAVALTFTLRGGRSPRHIPGNLTGGVTSKSLSTFLHRNPKQPETKLRRNTE